MDMELRRMLLTMTVVLGCLGVTGGLVWQFSWSSTSGESTTQPARARPAAAGELSAERSIVAAWDRRRARAWEQGDVRRLRGLYVSGSDAGRRDLEMLRDYRKRGLTVRGMRMQVLTWKVVRSEPDRLVVDLTDRLTGAQVIGGDDRVRALPTDRATQRRLTLVRQQGRWLMARVRSK